MVWNICYYYTKSRWFFSLQAIYLALVMPSPANCILLLLPIIKSESILKEGKRLGEECKNDGTNCKSSSFFFPLLSALSFSSYGYLRDGLSLASWFAVLSLCTYLSFTSAMRTANAN